MKEFHNPALESLWNALSHGRSKRNIDDQFAWILLMLLWAKWIPQTTKEFIGYFDSLESINFNSTYLVKEISRRIDLDLSDICETNNYKFVGGSELEELRNILMPVARLVAKDDKENIDFIIREIYFLKSKGQVLFNPTYQLYFVPHQASFHIFHLCNHHIAEWLEELNFEVNGWVTLSDWELSSF